MKRAALLLALVGYTTASSCSRGSNAEEPTSPPPRPCTNRSDCAEGEICAAGVCVPGECQQREDCPNPRDQVCNEAFLCIPDPLSPVGNQCPGGDVDCGLGQFCSAGSCYDTVNRTACQRPGDCGGQERCDPRSGFCVPNKGGCDRCAQYPELCCIPNEEACDPETLICRPMLQGNTCTTLTVQEDCRPGERCHNSRCVQCITDEHCGAGTRCNNATGTCVSSSSCQQDEDCAAYPGRRCAPATHQCTVPQCSEDGECTRRDARQRCNLQTLQCFLPPATCAEQHEPDDTPAQASPLSRGSGDADHEGQGTLCRGDRDVMSFPVSANQRVEVLLTLIGGDTTGVQVVLDGPDGPDPLARAVLDGQTTHRLGGNVTTAGTVYLALVGSGTEAEQWLYNVQVWLAPALRCDAEPGEPNDQPVEAGNSVLATHVTTRALCGNDDVDHHLFHAAANTRVMFTVTHEPDPLGRFQRVELLTADGESLEQDSYSDTLVVETRVVPEAKDLVLRVSAKGAWSSEADASDTAPPLVYSITITEEPLPTCTDQAQEPNDSIKNASAMDADEIHGVICDVTDADWYTFTLPVPSPVAIQLSTASSEELILRLVDARGETLQSDYVGNPKTLDLNQLPAGTWYLHVYTMQAWSMTLQSQAPDVEATPYVLTLRAPGLCADDRWETASSNDDRITAAHLRDQVEGPFRYKEELRLCPADEDWFQLVALGSECIRALISGLPGAEVSVRQYSSSGGETSWPGHAEGEGGTQSVDVPLQATAGLYYVVVSGTAQTSGPYTLSITVDEGQCQMGP